jgi:hypothetical protein
MPLASEFGVYSNAKYKLSYRVRFENIKGGRSMIHIKNLEVLNLHRILISVVHWIFREFGFPVIITSAHRPGDHGIHDTMPVRAVDIRCRDKKIGGILSDSVNLNWEYDPERPGKYAVCYPHGSGLNYHLHIQVHPNTKRR